MTKFQPVICQSPYVGYTDSQLAQAFGVDPKVWVACKHKLMFAERIEVDTQNVIRIIHWDRYAGRYIQGRAGREGASELRLWTEEDEIRKRGINKVKDAMFREIIAYLNTKSGRRFPVASGTSFKHFSARFDEGATLDQFKHVIGVKCVQWLGRKEMEPFLRPSTLFNKEKFWEYVGEPATIKEERIGEVGRVTIMPEEQKKYEAEAKAEYDRRLKVFMNSKGYKTEEEIPFNEYAQNRLPTFTEFFKKFIEEKRKSSDWSLS